MFHMKCLRQDAESSPHGRVYGGFMKNILLLSWQASICGQLQLTLIFKRIKPGNTGLNCERRLIN